MDRWERTYPGLLEEQDTVANNLLIISRGALGDNGYMIPALNILRDRYDEIWLSGKQQAKRVLDGTGLIDHFVIEPDNFYKWKLAYQQEWYREVTKEIGDFRTTITPHGAVPGRLCFQKEDKLSRMPAVWKRAINRGRNYFDETSKWVGVHEAVGNRPVTVISHKERSWLRDLRHIYKIPKDAFLMGWQFIGSSSIKWYPYFKHVVQESIMEDYPEVYVFCTGDMSGQLVWKKGHGGRCVNVTNKLTFRQVYLATSVFDLLVSPETGVHVLAQAFPDTPKILLATHTAGDHICCGEENTILRSEAKCAPCYNLVDTCKKDGGNPWQLCPGQISPKRVIIAIREVIERWRVHQ